MGYVAITLKENRTDWMNDTNWDKSRKKHQTMTSSHLVLPPSSSFEHLWITFNPFEFFWTVANCLKFSFCPLFEFLWILCSSEFFSTSLQFLVLEMSENTKGLWTSEYMSLHLTTLWYEILVFKKERLGVVHTVWEVNARPASCNRGARPLGELPLHVDCLGRITIGDQ